MGPQESIFFSSILFASIRFTANSWSEAKSVELIYTRVAAWYARIRSQFWTYLFRWKYVIIRIVFRNCVAYRRIQYWWKTRVIRFAAISFDLSAVDTVEYLTGFFYKIFRYSYFLLPLFIVLRHSLVVMAPRDFARRRRFGTRGTYIVKRAIDLITDIVARETVLFDQYARYPEPVIELKIHQIIGRTHSLRTPPFI